jgi:hypothetical protein
MIPDEAVEAATRGVSKDPTFDPDCNRCDYDLHVCGGCGENLRHDGKLHDGSVHPVCT